MTSRRTAKAAEAIRETVSTTILFGLKDPRIKNVTVLSVEAAGDLRSCKVYVSIMGSEKRQALAMHGLRAARGFLQAKLADRLQTRNTPVIEFVLDQGVKRSIEASRLLHESGTDFSVPPQGDGEVESGAEATIQAAADEDEEDMDEEGLDDDLDLADEYQDDEDLDDEEDLDEEDEAEHANEALSGPPRLEEGAGGSVVE